MFTVMTRQEMTQEARSCRRIASHARSRSSAKFWLAMAISFEFSLNRGV